MKPLNRMVLVVAREGADLESLAGPKSSLKNPCGNIGRIIAERVLDGRGKASMPAGDIKMAVDTTSGVNAILDNFDLFDERTQQPLLFHLL